MMNSEKKYLIVVCGPTASGKTALGIQLANLFNTIIISADSKQFYKEMTIGTAKPTLEEQAQAPHYFVDNISIFEQYTVGNFEAEVITFLKEKFKEKKVIIMVGGSGLFIDAVCNGLDKFPPIPNEIRVSLNHLFEEKGIDHLQQQLKLLDFEYYQLVDIQNHRRLMRALEVCLASQKPYSSFLKKTVTERFFEVIKIGIDWEKKELHNRIDKRTSIMEHEGLLTEVKALYPFKNLNTLNTIGYSELFEFLDGKVTYEQAIENLKTNTKKYAKRQMTWLKKDKNIEWFKVQDLDNAVRYVSHKMITHNNILR